MTSWQIRLLASIGVVAALTASVSGCGAGPSGDAGTTVVQVTAEMFSGRPDPSWTLTDDESTRLVRCLAGGTTGGPPAGWPPDNLGFRRFRVDGLPDSLPYRSVGVTAAAVVAEPGDGPHLVAGCPDAYELLRDSARAHLSDSDFRGIPAGPGR